MEITATQPVRGASILTLSIAEAKPAPAAAHRPMTTPTTAIPTGTGQNTTKRSIAEQKAVRPAAIPVMSMLTMWIPMATANVTPAAQPFR